MITMEARNDGGVNGVTDNAVNVGSSEREGSGNRRVSISSSGSDSLIEATPEDLELLATANSRYRRIQENSVSFLVYLKPSFI